MFTDLKIGVAKRRMAAAIKSPFTGNENQSHRIGVILDSDKEHLKTHFLLLKEELGLRDTHFQIVVCNDEGSKEDDLSGVVFSRKDLSWNGKIRNGEIMVFARQEMDVLISFTETDNKLAALLISVMNAGFKVGRGEELDSTGLFDMVISTGFDEVEIFISELKKYLKILNKIE